MSFDPRRFLQMVDVGALAASLPGRNPLFAEEAAGGMPPQPADYTIRIGTGSVELAPASSRRSNPSRRGIPEVGNEESHRSTSGSSARV